MKRLIELRKLDKVNEHLATGWQFAGVYTDKDGNPVYLVGHQQTFEEFIADRQAEEAAEREREQAELENSRQSLLEREANQMLGEFGEP